MEDIMMDYQQMRRIMHQKAKDLHKTNVFVLKEQLLKQEKNKELNRFFKAIQTVLIVMLMILFVGIITTNQNAEISIGERTLQMFKERGFIE
jgi:hypothetical protein